MEIREEEIPRYKYSIHECIDVLMMNHTGSAEDSSKVIVNYYDFLDMRLETWKEKTLDKYTIKYESLLKEMIQNTLRVWEKDIPVLRGYIKTQEHLNQSSRRKQ